MAMSDLHRKPQNLYLINNVKDIFVFLGLIKKIPQYFPAVETPHNSLFVEKTQLKMNRFENHEP